MTKSPHVPVLLDEVLQALAPNPRSIYVDGTFGAGGYSKALLSSGAGRVVGIDRDPDAVAIGRAMAPGHAGRLTVLQGRFSDMEGLLAELGLAAVDGVALDVGVSSMQLDRAERGFAFSADGPLDMRMEQHGPTAADLVNRLAEGELADLIYAYGEERRSRRIARAIVRARPIHTTAELTRAIASAVGGKRHDGPHPATRTFQALRIKVNDELDELALGLAAAERVLAPKGRLAVVSFHSLEDRIVKRFLESRAGRAPAPSRHLPPAQAPVQQPSFRLLFAGARKPSEGESAANPRARSARLRAAERTEAPAWPSESLQ